MYNKPRISNINNMINEKSYNMVIIIIISSMLSYVYNSQNGNGIGGRDKTFRRFYVIWAEPTLSGFT